MELSELRKSAHLSASAINDYLDCSLLFKFGRIDRIEPEFKSDAMEFGSAIHMALAEFHQEKLTGNILTTKEFHDRFEDSWTRIAEGQDDIIKYSEGKDFNTLLLEGKELLTAYYNKFTWQQFNVLAVEEPFSFTIEGCPVPIVGAIDLIESDESDTIIITDFKTSARAYSLDEVDRNFQLTLYQMALKTNGYHDREILLRFDCLIKTKQPKFDQYYSMLPGIVDHSIQVMRVSMALVDNLKSGVLIDRDLVVSAALLHDITKTRSLTTKEHHDISAGVLLRELGFNRVAEIVEEHVILHNFLPHGKLEEREIIYYADKRVMHDKIVTIEERVQDLIQRYGSTEEIRNLILSNMSMVWDVEKKIAGFMAIDIESAIQQTTDIVW
jgi:putative RecB family exonuclease